ncbi:MAG TPA: beta-1,6-N-acetylglucosaminyltransferase [Flavisolibacter sp.]|jgi:hypothetical protein
MNKAYLILAHKYPLQLYRLYKALEDEHSTFFIHIDKKVEMTKFQELVTDKKVRWVNRAEANWGEFGLVEAVLNLLQAVKDCGKKFDRIILLSGQDYPIKSNHTINEYLRQSAQRTFIEYHPLPSPKKWKPHGGLYRVNKYFFGFGFHQRVAAKMVNLLAMIVPLLERNIPKGMKPYAGSTWWIIDDYSMRYILDFVADNPGYVAFHKNTFAADEVFFHMILLNATDEKVKAKIVNDDKRFIKWKDIHAAHPEQLTEKDMDEIRCSDALFARKFDITNDEEMLDLIERQRSIAPGERKQAS